MISNLSKHFINAWRWNGWEALKKAKKEESYIFSGKQYITIHQLASIVGINATTLKRLLVEHKINSIKFKNKLYIDIEKADAVLQIINLELVYNTRYYYNPNR